MLESQGYSPGTVDDQLKTVKSWMRHFDVEIRRKIKVSSNNFTPTLQNERVPNAAEMGEIYSRADMREPAIISMMAKSGLRPKVIGNSDGTDGLRMRDMPDLVIRRGMARCIRTPNRIVARRELPKAGHRYLRSQLRLPQDTSRRTSTTCRRTASRCTATRPWYRQTTSTSLPAAETLTRRFCRRPG